MKTINAEEGPIGRVIRVGQGVAREVTARASGGVESARRRISSPRHRHQLRRSGRIHDDFPDGHGPSGSDEVDRPEPSPGLD